MNGPVARTDRANLREAFDLSAFITDRAAAKGTQR